MNHTKIDFLVAALKLINQTTGDEWQTQCRLDEKCINTLQASAVANMIPQITNDNFGRFLQNFAETVIGGSFHATTAFEENRLILNYRNELEMEMIDILSIITKSISGKFFGDFLPGLHLRLKQFYRYEYGFDRDSNPGPAYFKTFT